MDANSGKVLAMRSMNDLGIVTAAKAGQSFTCSAATRALLGEALVVSGSLLTPLGLCWAIADLLCKTYCLSTLLDSLLFFNICFINVLFTLCPAATNALLGEALGVSRYQGKTFVVGTMLTLFSFSCGCFVSGAIGVGPAVRACDGKRKKEG